MNEHLSKNQINSLLRKLNACYSDFSQWQLKKAQKKHIDMFGQQINTGDHYYRARTNADFSFDLKLSENSMERFLYLIFINGPVWEQQADKTITDKHNEIRNIMDKLRPPG